MEKENKKKSKIDMVSAASTAAGAAIGTVGGNFVSAELNAQEMHEPNITAETHDTPQQHDMSQPNVINITVEVPDGNVTIPDNDTIDVVNPEPIKEPDVEPYGMINPDLEIEPELDIEVLSYETVTNEDGSQMDVAFVDIDGMSSMVVDVDKDGVADVLAIDINGNGELDVDEIADISEENMPMNIFKDELINNNVYYADNGDYVNDADVTDYLA